MKNFLKILIVILLISLLIFALAVDITSCKLSTNNTIQLTRMQSSGTITNVRVKHHNKLASRDYNGDDILVVWVLFDNIILVRDNL